jgi:hypothetical protein
LTEFSFANGVKIHIPDCDNKENQIQLWTDVKVQMSLILDPPPAEEVKERKPYPMASWTQKRKRQTAKAVRAFHRKKTWRSAKKLK